MKIKKFLLIFLTILFLFTISSFFLIKYALSYQTIYLWNSSWGFNVPKPTKITTVFENTGRDIMAYHICEYDSSSIEEVEKLKFWNQIDDESYNQLSNKIEEYKKQIDPTYINNFTNYPVQFDKNSLWTIKGNNGDPSNTLIAILNVNQKKLYVMEVTY